MHQDIFTVVKTFSFPGVINDQFSPSDIKPNQVDSIFTNNTLETEAKETGSLRPACAQKLDTVSEVKNRRKEIWKG